MVENENPWSHLKTKGQNAEHFRWSDFSLIKRSGQRLWHSMFKIRRFIHVSYSKNRDWKPIIPQTLTNMQEIFHVMWMLTVPTPLDHMYVHVTLDTLEMDKLAQVIFISFLQSQLFKAEGNLKRPFNSNCGGRSSQTFILKCSSTP